MLKPGDVLPVGNGNWGALLVVPAAAEAQTDGSRPPSSRSCVSDPPSAPSSSSSAQGIWRIPVDEIDRPGSFASHMNRSIVLLLEVLYQLKDHDTLLKVSFMLQRTPDQGK